MTTAKPTGLDVQVRLFKNAMFFFSLCFLCVGLFFIFSPHSTIQYLNSISLMTHIGHPISEIQDFFWLALAGSMMMTVAYLCFMSYQNPLDPTPPRAVLITKFSSTAFFFISFLRTSNAWYLLGSIVDGFIFCFILFLYIRTIHGAKAI